MILGIDTSMGTSVALIDPAGDLLAERTTTESRGHAEAIGALLRDVLAEAGVPAAAVTAVAVGMGPAPFTGLRVGIAAARAFALARGVPLLPVVSHAAVAFELAEAGELGRVVVITDAKRREHYWSVFDLGMDALPELVGGPGLSALDTLGEIAGVDESVRRVEPEVVRAAAVARLALRRDAAGLESGPQQPLYLREPDVTPSKGPKRVTG